MVALETAPLEDEIDAFHQEAEREIYLVGAGLKGTLELGPIYQRHGELFARATAEEALRARDGRRTRYLAEFLVLEHLQRVVTDLTEEVANHLLDANASWQGEDVAYHDLPIRIANEPDAPSRHELEAIQMAMTDQVNPQRRSRWRILHSRARDLGFPHYAGLCDELRSLDLAGLSAEMERLLHETAEAHFEELGQHLHRLGLSESRAATADIAYLFRGVRWDPFFPRDTMLGALHKTLLGLGIDLAGQDNVEVDSEPRPRKSARAFCVGIRIPDEVKLVIKPSGGQDDYRSLFHEAGHAEHFSHVDAGLPVAFRRLGDNSVTESYAFLVEHLLMNPAWLEEMLGIEDAGGYLDYARFRKRYMLRRYASKLRYEWMLHSEGEEPAPLYASLLGENLGVKVYPERYLDDVDDGFYCAQYLRAWIFEVQHRRFLEERFGQRWFADREAGSHLIRLWRTGQELKVEELALKLGYGGLDLAPLLEELA